MALPYGAAVWPALCVTMAFPNHTRLLILVQPTLTKMTMKQLSRFHCRALCGALCSPLFRRPSLMQITSFGESVPKRA